MAEQADVSDWRPEPESGRMTRREWELSERLSELENSLASRIERDEIREIEIRSLRAEVELRIAYNAALEQELASTEQLAEERLQRIGWLQGHLDHLVSIPTLAPILSEDDARAELLAERQRLSHRIVDRISRHRRLFDTARGAVGVIVPRRKGSDLGR